MTDRDLLEERLMLDARPGPAARISKERASAMVEAALDAAFQSAPSAAAMESPAEPKRASGLAALLQHPASRALLIAAAALLMLVGGAAAAKLALQTFFADKPAPIDAPAAPKAAAPKHAAAAVQPIEEPAAIEAEEEEPAIEARERTQRQTRDTRDDEQEDLLQRASRERAAGRFRDAAETYALVYERPGSTLSAYVAAVAAGSLELEHLDSPTRAAKLFRRALRTRPNGALDLEARQGLAFALRDMGAEKDEIAALRALIHAHPDRPAAQRARARLRELHAEPNTP